MGEVIQLDQDLPCAICPKCECSAWHIEVKSFLSDADDITAFECCDCGYRIEIVESDEPVTTFRLEE